MLRRKRPQAPRYRQGAVDALATNVVMNHSVGNYFESNYDFDNLVAQARNCPVFKDKLERGFRAALMRYPFFKKDDPTRLHFLEKLRENDLD